SALGCQLCMISGDSREGKSIFRQIRKRLLRGSNCILGFDNCSVLICGGQWLVSILVDPGLLGQLEINLLADFILQLRDKIRRNKESVRETLPTHADSPVLVPYLFGLTRLFTLRERPLVF